MRENTGLTTAIIFVILILLSALLVDVALLGGLIVVGASIIWLGLLPLAIYRVVSRSGLPWRRRLFPVYLILLPFLVLPLFSFIHKLFYKADWFIATAPDFTGSDEFRFKENGDFEYWRDSPIGSSLVVKGSYTQQDSVLVLHYLEINKLDSISGFIMRPYVHYNEQFKIQPNILLPIDVQGNKVESFGFYVKKR